MRVRVLVALAVVVVLALAVAGCGGTTATTTVPKPTTTTTNADRAKLQEFLAQADKVGQMARGEVKSTAADYKAMIEIIRSYNLPAYGLTFTEAKAYLLTALDFRSRYTADRAAEVQAYDDKYPPESAGGLPLPSQGAVYAPAPVSGQDIVQAHAAIDAAAPFVKQLAAKAQQ